MNSILYSYRYLLRTVTSVFSLEPTNELAAQVINYRSYWVWHSVSTPELLHLCSGRPLFGTKLTASHRLTIAAALDIAFAREFLNADDVTCELGLPLVICHLSPEYHVDPMYGLY